jgi:hypothetical protein
MLFLSLALVIVPSADPPVWRIPAEVRVQRRFDPALREARALAAHHARVASGGTPVPVGREQEVIVGRDNPELLLPFEIFRRLIRVGFASDPEVRDVYRQSLEQARREVGLPDDFWVRLEAITSRVRLKSAAPQMQAVEMGQEQTVMTPEARVLCSERAAALARARAEFGEDTFDRFLYLGVAPSMFIATVGEGPTPELLLEFEKGCPQ